MQFTDYLDRSAFDPTTPPSVDFYRHVNGGWLDANPVPSEYPAWGAGLEVHVRNENILHELLLASADETGPRGSASQMVGDYFAAGMAMESIAASGTTPLHRFLDGIASIETIADVGEQMLILKRLGVGAFHSLGVFPDFEDADRYLVYLGQGGIGLPERDYYLRDDERSMALSAAYMDHVTAQLENLGSGRRVEAEAIFQLEKRLAEASLPAENLRDLKLTLNRHRVDDLDELMPGFGLTAYVRRLGVTSESVNIDHPTFFTALDEVLSETPIETVRTYLSWHLIRKFASALPGEFEDEAFDFYNRKVGGQQQPRERWTRILGAATADVGEHVARLYVESAFSAQAKSRCEQMVDGLIEAMGRSIESLDWMTEDTKRAALAKVATFTHKIGYPDAWRDYTGLEIVRKPFVENRIAAAEFEFDRQLGRLGQPVDKGEWEIPAHEVNAYYNPLLNEVVFPAGILQPPFFHEHADDAVNYGAIGAVIGHEITHGFDDNGSQFDEVGRRRNWWTDEDRAEFERRAEVLVEQFSEYEVNDDQKVNGRLTLGENIADLGGLAIAYDAFAHSLDGAESHVAEFTPRQRFFLSYATIWRMNYTEEYLRMLTNIDVHAPNPFRVNGPLSNLGAFSDAFDIHEPTPMRRADDERARIW
jgi:putative endopeptidase